MKFSIKGCFIAAQAVTLLPVFVSQNAAAQTPLFLGDNNTSLSDVRRIIDPVAIDDEFYMAADGPFGTEPYRYNPATNSFELLADIETGPESSEPRAFTAHNGSVYFKEDGSSPLYRSENQRLDVLTSPGLEVIDPPNRKFASTQHGLYFIASDGDFGDCYLYMTDGTASGTRQVLTEPVAYYGPFQLGNKVLYVSGNKLKAIDGPESTPVEIATVNDFVEWDTVSQYGWFLYTDGDTTYKTDGTPDGTSVVDTFGLDFLRPINDSSDGPVLFYSSNGEVVTISELLPTGELQSIMDSDTIGGYISSALKLNNLYVYEAEINGTSSIAVYDGSTSVTLTNDSSFMLTPVGSDHFAFVQFTDETGFEPYISDGTVTGTRMIADLAPGSDFYEIRDFITSGSDMLITLSSGHGGPVPAYHYNIDSDMVSGVPTPGPASNFKASYQVRFGDKVVFSASDGIHGVEPWVTDGTVDGTKLLKDIRPGTSSSDAAYFTELDGVVYFFANSNEPGEEDLYDLWKTDGTEAGTQLVADVAVFEPVPMRVVDGKLYFVAEDSDDYYRYLYQSDGTEAGTIQLDQAASEALAVINGKIAFVDQADERVHIVEPATNSITELGSGMPEIYFLEESVEIPGGTLVNLETDEVWFVSDDFEEIREILRGRVYILQYTVNGKGLIFDHDYAARLYSTDGSGDEPELLAEFDNDDYVASDYISDYRELPHVAQLNDGRVVFLMYKEDSGVEPWITDGTATGTMLLKDINPGSAGSVPTQLKSAGNLIYFGADDGVHGHELWQTDGTSTGTVMVADLNPGPAGSMPGSRWSVPDLRDYFNINFDAVDSEFMAYQEEQLFFAANDGDGLELWSLPVGDTQPVKYDVNPGPGASNPMDFVPLDNLLVFTAGRPETGLDLWALPVYNASVDDWNLY